MSKSIKITDCNFDQEKVKIHKGKDLKFSSTDNKEYKVDASQELSGDFPLVVNADGSESKAKVKDKAPVKDYTCTITEGCTDGAPQEKGMEMAFAMARPTMIIQVE